MFAVDAPLGRAMPDGLRHPVCETGRADPVCREGDAAGDAWHKVPGFLQRGGIDYRAPAVGLSMERSRSGRRKCTWRQSGGDHMVCTDERSECLLFADWHTLGRACRAVLMRRTPWLHGVRQRGPDEIWLPGRPQVASGNLRSTKPGPVADRALQMWAALGAPPGLCRPSGAGVGVARPICGSSHVNTRS